MKKNFTLAITGDSIVNRRLSIHADERFLSLIEILRAADVAYTHLETVIHDYEGDGVYPAAESGWTWMRSPRFVADELKWAGFDIVSHASNHCLDYSYGGLFSTLKALDEAGLPHAGTGRDLGEAREPAYLDTPGGRIALVSMSSSYVSWARAGERRRDVEGRPGLNPLRYYYVADVPTLEMVKEVAFRLGWNISNPGGAWWFNPPGASKDPVIKIVETKGPGVSTAVDDDDAEGNLRSIRDAARQADYVLVHLHNHEWNPAGSLSVPPTFVPPFARACIEAGADVFVAEGSHSPLRGIEIYNGKPIFYDPGDFMFMSDTVTRLPADFYSRMGFGPGTRWDARPADGFEARKVQPPKLNPRRDPSPAKSAVVGICSLGDEGALKDLRLYPIVLGHEPRSKKGLPMLAGAGMAGTIIKRVAELSAPFGTTIDFVDGAGVVRLALPP
ncbi:MAG: CapA family protein [Chloroflexi bacterium]|nr:CapA family protein [Chloroflexota bacterium]